MELTLQQAPPIAVCTVDALIRLNLLYNAVELLIPVSHEKEKKLNGVSNIISISVYYVLLYKPIFKINVYTFLAGDS